VASEWYCNIQGNMSGPHTGSVLRDMVKAGILPPEGMLRRGVDGIWVRADSVGGLKFEQKVVANTFRIIGPDRKSGKSREILITAESQDQANRLAAEAGIVTGTAHDAEVAFLEAQKQLGEQVVTVTQNRKYPNLSLVANLYRYLAVVCVLAAGVGVVAGIVQANRNQDVSVVIVIMSLFGGVLSTISMLALAEGIELMVDIEDNLRQIRDKLPK
jgi:hypothetical protein